MSNLYSKLIAFCSRKGTVFHESMGKHFSEGYGEGDVLGVLIELPDVPSGNYIPPTYKDKVIMTFYSLGFRMLNMDFHLQPLVKFKSHLYYEDRDEIQEALKSLKSLPGSKIHFFKNGVHQGTGFVDIYAGNYYPAVALFKNVTVSVNFGPNFKHPPKDFEFRGVRLSF